VLGLKKGASLDDIRSSFRAKSFQYHPDVAKDKATASERFREVLEAYQTLRDPVKRAQYDATL
jgi:DnaJ-class molecular chaperone